VAAKLYWFPLSHPSHAARRMLELKGVDHRLAGVLPGNQRVHLRLVGFRGGTVPALRLDGRRIQGSRQIARALEQLGPEPPLFPADPELRARVVEAERWGDEVLQPVPRRILRWGLVRELALRRWLAENHSALPAPGVGARLSGPLSRYYAYKVGADADAVRADLAALPQHLEHVDALLADGTLGADDEPNAARFQVLCTVRSLLGYSDLQEFVASHACAAAARATYPDFPPALIPPFIPADWLAPLRRPAAAVE
jgi:glutathione S-transferase